MIRKFKYGYILNNKASRVFNIYTGASGNCGENNAVFRKENPLLVPDILSWWDDE